MNCGACGHVCTPGIACVAGTCQQKKCTGALSFQKIAAYPPSLDSSWYLGADMNRDGQLDVLEYTALSMLDYTDDGNGVKLAIWLGNGDGTFVASTHYATTGTAQTWNLPDYAAVGDFNEDGLADLVVTKVDGSDAHVRPGLEGGGLGGRAGAPSSRVLMGDLDGDGHLDFVNTAPHRDNSHSQILILRGSGHGTFVGPSSYRIPNDYADAVALLDWNGDGALDILAMAWAGLHIVYGNGDGTFAEDQQCGVVGGVFADLNQDGRFDIIWDIWQNQQLAMVFGQGGCNFTPRTNFPLPVQSQSFALGDLTGDGLQDVLIYGSVSTAPLFTVNRDGTFSSQPGPDIDTSDAQAVWITDVNSDGRADVVYAGSRGIEVYANTCDR